MSIWMPHLSFAECVAYVPDMTEAQNIPEPPFDRAEAARRLGVKESWLRDHRNDVPFVRMGRFIRYTQGCLDAYLDRQTVDLRTKHRPLPRKMTLTEMRRAGLIP